MNDAHLWLTRYQSYAPGADEISFVLLPENPSSKLFAPWVIFCRETHATDVLLTVKQGRALWAERLVHGLVGYWSGHVGAERFLRAALAMALVRPEFVFNSEFSHLSGSLRDYAWEKHLHTIDHVILERRYEDLIAFLSVNNSAPPAFRAKILSLIKRLLDERYLDSRHRPTAEEIKGLRALLRQQSGYSSSVALAIVPLLQGVLHELAEKDGAKGLDSRFSVSGGVLERRHKLTDLLKSSELAIEVLQDPGTSASAIISGPVYTYDRIVNSLQSAVELLDLLDSDFSRSQHDKPAGHSLLAGLDPKKLLQELLGHDDRISVGLKHPLATRSEYRDYVDRRCFQMVAVFNGIYEADLQYTDISGSPLLDFNGIEDPVGLELALTASHFVIWREIAVCLGERALQRFFAPARFTARTLGITESLASAITLDVLALNFGQYLYLHQNPGKPLILAPAKRLYAMRPSLAAWAELVVSKALPKLPATELVDMVLRLECMSAVHLSSRNPELQKFSARFKSTYADLLSVSADELARLEKFYRSLQKQLDPADLVF